MTGATALVEAITARKENEDFEVRALQELHKTGNVDEKKFVADEYS